jgi:ribosomal protein S18 acetylase RimI-like enzyme
MSPSDYERAVEFVMRGDLFGTRVEPWKYGTAVFTPEIPLRHDSNYLVLERDGDAADIAAEAHDVQSELGHRIIDVWDEALGERLAPGFERLGWEIGRFVFMAHRRPPEREVDVALASEVDAITLRAARERDILSYPWGTPELAEQLLEARRLNPLETRFYAVLVDGEPVSWTDLYLDRDTGQVEAVATAPEHRNRGYASAVVLRAVEEARSAGASFVFLVADAEDWPKELYRKLGFDEIGRYVKFVIPSVPGR